MLGHFAAAILMQLWPTVKKPKFNEPAHYFVIIARGSTIFITAALIHDNCELKEKYITKTLKNYEVFGLCCYFTMTVMFEHLLGSISVNTKANYKV